jgi:hypothetical protein
MPAQKIYKETIVEYLPNLQEINEVEVKPNQEINIKIIVKNGWKINPSGPSFINLLEIKNKDNATLLATYDWDAISRKNINFLKLEEGKNYLLQSKIYFCKNSPNALCYVKSYEQKIIPKQNSAINQIEISVGN